MTRSNKLTVLLVAAIAIAGGLAITGVMPLTGALLFVLLFASVALMGTMMMGMSEV